MSAAHVGRDQLGTSVGPSEPAWAPERRAGAVLLRWTFLWMVLVGGLSCAVSRPFDIRPPPPEAERAFEAARAALWDRDLLGPEREAERELLLERAHAALSTAAAADPTWVGPERLKDDLERFRLRGQRAYAERLAQVRSDPGDAVALYLLGRLEPDAASQRFAQALAADPSLAFAHHGLSVEHQNAGRERAAVSAAARALSKARGGYEAALFARRLALLLRERGSKDAPREVLEETLARTDLGPLDRLELETALAREELEQERDREVVERGYRRALALVAGGRLTRDMLADLLTAMRAGLSGRSAEAWALEVTRALSDAASRGNAAYLDPALLLRADVTGVGAWLRPSPNFTPAAERRFLAVAGGNAPAAVEAWRAALPPAVLCEQGLPKDPRLSEVVLAARALGAGRGAELSLALAAAFQRAGWYADALAQAQLALGGGADPAQVEVVATAARAGAALVGELSQVIRAVRGGDSSWWIERDPEFSPGEPWPLATAPRGGSPKSLQGILDAAARMVERYGGPLGLDDPELLARIRTSPALSFGPLAKVLVPGPIFAERDQVMGVGTAGATVPGLAECLHALGRVALLGKAAGQAPDGTVLRRLHHERIQGERLGVPYEGLVIWCEGVDVAGGYARAGSAVSGAALHEGYWIDVESERRRLVRWRQLEARFFAPGRDAERAGLLADPGLSLSTDGEHEALRRLERRQLWPALGAADRLRIALLEERRGQGGSVELSDLLEVVEVHEQGHLTDRHRFLPLSDHPWRAFRFALSAGFSPKAMERELEWRAQLVALCELGDPRFALVDLLDAADVPQRGAGVHAAAYRRLLSDMLAELDRRMADQPDAYPQLDRHHVLLYQLHRLTGEEVRDLARAIARRARMLADG